MFIESVRARATCNTIISSHPVSSRRPCIPPCTLLVSLSLSICLPSSQCLLICYLSFLLFFSLFLSRAHPLALLSWFYFHRSLLLFSPWPFSFSTRHLIPHLRDVHSILSHLLEVTRDRPSPHFLWTSAPSFISNSANARTYPPASIARLIFARHVCNDLEMVLDTTKPKTDFTFLSNRISHRILEIERLILLPNQISYFIRVSMSYYLLYPLYVL